MPAENSSAPLLRVSDLTITHDGNSAASPDRVSFTVSPGEVVLLLGPSGSGKSTLTLALNGLIPHDVPATVTGNVTVAGLDTATATPAELSPHVAMVFQDPDAQLVTGSLLDEVCFGPENLLLPVPDVLRRAEWALRRVHLWDRRHDNPDALSGGGRQRLAIACALAMGAPLLVLDEPTANLDPAGVEEVYSTLGEIVHEQDRAVVLVEHDLDEAIGIATRIIALDADGRLAVDGPAAEVLRDRADELAALGVWLPTATLAALHLRDAGVLSAPLPITVTELRDRLPEAVPAGVRSGPEAAPEPIIRVRDLTVRRGARPVLDRVSLDVPRGSFTAIVGGNGAGKTTLLQAIAGVVRPPKRAIDLDGVDPGRVAARSLASRIGFVFQNPEHQFIAPTVRDELAVGLRAQRLPEDEVRARVDEVLERFGLTDRADSHPFLLSGGQKRRLSVGTALMTGAPILALDEPTFGQDRARAAELLSLLHDLNDAGTTIVIVTHDMQLVADSTTHVVAFSGGRVALAGTPRSVFAEVDRVNEIGLRLPALPRMVRGVPGYEAVWTLDDLVRTATKGSR
ncbi:ABC transporter ATP-binding protein [Microbacterium gorillae]|uniref:ABC transporter ATP-binding protein n=1 Tax=Microbacterium gorillae TaxID=1231063 RepID=UPI000693F680|nr:energy-coupling factor transporter ATPase [Microbacterium gorillae]